MDNNLKKEKYHWRPLTPKDKPIMELLKKDEYKEGLLISDIYSLTDICPQTIYNRIARLEMDGFVEIINSNPKIVKWNFRGCKQFFKIKCPKCGTEKWADPHQITATCDNPICITKSGIITRFRINKWRIVDKAIIS